MTARVRINVEPAKRMAEYFALLTLHQLCVGVPGSKGGATHPGSNITVATVGLFLEYGTIDAPARSFLRSTVFERSAEIADLYAREIAAGLREAIAGHVDAVGPLSRIGAGVAQMVRDKVDSAAGWAAANAPSTIKKKGHGQPLLGGDIRRGIAGGTLRDAIGWSVRRAGAVIAEAA